MNKIFWVMLFFASWPFTCKEPDEPPEPPAPGLPPVERSQMIATVQDLSQHNWICREENRVAPCVTVPYESDWQVNESVTGIAYDWGGMDGTEEFDRKLAEGQAAGSHSWHGSTDCTAGTDCSGLVSFVWGQKKKYATTTIHEIANQPEYNWFTDMKPGDALNKPGSHIVLFAGYRDDGNPIVYESVGSASKVILNEWSTWARYRDYSPLQYKMVVDK